MVTRAIAAAAGAILIALPAAAERLPAWNIADICRSDSAPGQCSLFEARARNAVSGSWEVLPADVQSACIAATKAPADQSWRALAGCIEHQILRAKGERAIATRATPSELEPPAPAAPATPAAPAEPAKAE